MGGPHTIERMLQDGEISGGEVKLFNRPEGYAAGFGIAAPTDAGAGWAPGALFLDLVAGAVYTNVGTKASCNFDLLTTGTDTALATLLASTDNGEGASLIGVEDSGTRFTTTNLESILEEVMVLTGIDNTLQGSVFSTMSNQALGLGPDSAVPTGGLQVQVLFQDVVLSGAAASHDLSRDIPDGSVIISVHLNNQTTIGATTATNVGLGVAADPDKYGLNGGTAKNAKLTALIDWAVLSGAEDVQLFACNGAGVATGTLDSGTVRVQIVYLAAGDLGDAA